MSNNSPQVHRLGVLLLKSRPLNNEVIREVPQNLPRQGQSLHSADALNVDNDHFLYPEDPKEQADTQIGTHVPGPLHSTKSGFIR